MVSMYKGTYGLDLFVTFCHNENLDDSCQCAWEGGGIALLY